MGTILCNISETIHITMKLYFLTPNTWGEHWTTCANSPEEALEQIKTYLRDTNGEGSSYNFLKDKTIDNLPVMYTLEEYPLTHVIEGEYS